MELQLSVQQWLHVKLASRHAHKPMKHEHHLTEASMKASRVVQGLAELRRSSALVQASMPGPVTSDLFSTTSSTTTCPSSSITPSSAPSDARRLRRRSQLRQSGQPPGSDDPKMAPHGRKTRCSAALALMGCFAVACAGPRCGTCLSRTHPSALSSSGSSRPRRWKMLESFRKVRSSRPSSTNTSTPRQWPIAFG